jgi:hypothetical protein
MVFTSDVSADTSISLKLQTGKKQSIHFQLKQKKVSVSGSR